MTKPRHAMPYWRNGWISQKYVVGNRVLGVVSHNRLGRVTALDKRTGRRCICNYLAEAREWVEEQFQEEQ